MKMVKSAFLASAAGLVAMSGAQAADLPVKAKPVEYVKVCSLYGAGFYYIPGTDICMKIGGYVRFQESTGSSGSISFGPLTSTGSYHNREASTDFTHRVRAVSTFDTRQQARLCIFPQFETSLLEFFRVRLNGTDALDVRPRESVRLVILRRIIARHYCPHGH